MKELLTSNNVPFWVDAEDFEVVSRYVWYYYKGAITRATPRPDNRGARQSLHQFLLASDGQGTREIDHKDRNPRNNCRGNLRRSDRVQQAVNQKLREDNSSGVKGVACKRPGTWMAYLDVGKVRHYLYSGKSFTEAVAARKAAEVKFHKPILEA